MTYQGRSDDKGLVFQVLLNLALKVLPVPGVICPFPRLPKTHDLEALFAQFQDVQIEIGPIPRSVESDNPR